MTTPVQYTTLASLVLTRVGDEMHVLENPDPTTVMVSLQMSHLGAWAFVHSLNDSNADDVIYAVAALFASVPGAAVSLFGRHHEDVSSVPPPLLLYPGENVMELLQNMVIYSFEWYIKFESSERIERLAFALNKVSEWARTWNQQCSGNIQAHAAIGRILSGHSETCF